MTNKLLQILNIVRPCDKYGHWWSDYCSSLAPAGRSVVTGRRCKKCREIQIIAQPNYFSMFWETQKVCAGCDEFCALDGEDFCRQCLTNHQTGL